MIYDTGVTYPDTGELLARLGTASLALRSFDALAAAETLFGDTAAANFLLVGAAYQLGGLRLPATAIEEAIGINGVAVSTNIAAFRWGRVAVQRPEDFTAATATRPSRRTQITVPAQLLDGLTATGETRRRAELRAGELIGFQNVRVARRYLGVVEHIWRAQRSVTERTEFSEAVAAGLYRFSAYKDEYEVARRLIDPEFRAEVGERVPDGAKLTYRLHPPILRAMGRRTKIGIGPRGHFALRVLAGGKRLRGTPFDPFGYARVRRVERELLAHYTAMVTALADELTPANYDRAVRAAALAETVRGYEDVKLAAVARYRDGLRELGIDPPRI